MKHLSILVQDDQTSLSTVACIVGASQVFSEANRFWMLQGFEAKFEIALVGVSLTHPLRNGFVTIQPQLAIADIHQTDLVLIPASTIRSYEGATPRNRQLIDWIGQQYKLGAEVASMCVGSFMLAATGLLSGKTCSTHWAMADHFRTSFPDVNLQTDRLITHENGLYTNGGAYSFLHLLIYLVEKYYDRQAALHCAKYFQIDIDRRFQAEFTIFNGHKQHQDEEILTAQTYIEENYQGRISVEELSANLNIGRRNFDRRFIKATGLTPIDYLQRVRIEAAKRAFETTRKTVHETMYDVGYSDTKAFRTVFSRVTGLSPLDYKTKYNKESTHLVHT